ncbi:hypothetical protein [Haloferax sp. DFSO60]|uniref:hypothetical protein n=1 Tax=Haloferax sp. DFSO60 TaxID=3388652 RepID=UPI00397DAC18
MGTIRKSVRLPISDLRQQVADAVGVAPSLLDIHDIRIEDGSLEVDVSHPDGSDIPAIELFVTDPSGKTDSHVTELDGAKTLLIAGEDVRVELVDYNRERNEVFVSAKHRQGQEWVTVLGCGEQWVVEVEEGGKTKKVQCRIESAIQPSEE